MRLLWPLAFLALVLAFLPAPASAQDDDYAARADLCIITYRPSEHFREVLVEADQEKSKAEMRKLLEQVDTDDDGTITAEEVQAYEDASERTENDSEDLGALKLVLDGYHAESVRFRTVLHGFEGGVDEEKGRLVSEHRAYRFPPTGGYEGDPDRHRLEGGLYADGEEYPNNIAIEFVVIEAPADWLVAAVNGTEYGQERVDLPAFDTKRYYTFTFERPGEPDVPPVTIPAPGLALVALLYVGLAAAHRPRHKR